MYLRSTCTCTYVHVHVHVTCACKVTYMYVHVNVHAHAHAHVHVDLRYTCNVFFLYGVVIIRLCILCLGASLAVSPAPAAAGSLSKNSQQGPTVRPTIDHPCSDPLAKSAQALVWFSLLRKRLTMWSGMYGLSVCL